MGRSPCCDKVGLKKGPWTPEEDHKLLAYIEQHGHGSWRALPAKAGLQRCGKSCRLRWTNYLRPDIKRGKFSLQEEQTIIQLHALLGNRWSAIATHLPKRTDNEIKNYWNTHLKKRLTKMGIDPVTHKPENDARLSSAAQSKSAANLSHMAQWESARLEAEARLARQSKLRSTSFNAQPIGALRSLDVLKAWNDGVWAKTGEAAPGTGGDLESPTSTLSSAAGVGECPASFANTSTSTNGGGRIIKEERDWMDLPEYRDGYGSSIRFTSGLEEASLSSAWEAESAARRSSAEHVPCGNFVQKFTDLLLSTSTGHRGLSDDCGESESGSGSGKDGGGEDNKNYWNCILNLVNASPSDSPII